MSLFSCQIESATADVAKLQKSYRIWVAFLKKLKIIAKILATFRKNAYLCTVRMYVLAIR